MSTSSLGKPPPFSQLSIVRGVSLTSLFSCFIITFADEFVIFHEVKFVASVELALANNAGETLEVVDVFLRPTHHLRGGNSLLTAGTLRPKPPETKAC